MNIFAKQDHALVKEHFDHQKAETQREQMRNEIDRMKRLLETSDSVVHKQVNRRRHGAFRGVSAVAIFLHTLRHT